MAQRREILKDLGFYVGFSYVSKFFDAASSLLIRIFLEPASMGIWALLQVVVNYAKHSTLGVQMAINRDVPYLRGKGTLKQAEGVQNAIFSFAIFAGSIVALGIVLYAFWSRHNYSNEIFYGLLTVAGIVVLQRLYNLLVALVRAHKDFALAGRTNVYSSSLTLLLSILLTWRFKLYGLYAGVLIHYVVLIVFLFWKTGYRFTFVHPLKNVRPFLSFGAAMVVSEALKTVFMSIDRIMIVKYLGLQTLGVYSIAIMIQNYLYGLPAMFNVVLFPRFQETYARSDSASDLDKLLHQPTLCIAYLFPVLVGVIWIIFPPVVEIVLPKYSEGIIALKILALGSYFLGLTYNFSTYIISVRKHWLLIPVQLTVIAVGFFSTWLLVGHGTGIEGVALAISVTQALFFVLLSYIGMRKNYSWRIVGVMYCKIFVTFTYVAVGLLFFDYLFWQAKIDLTVVVVQCVLFLIYSLPLFYCAEKETRLISAAKGLILDFVSRLIKKNSPR